MTTRRQVIGSGDFPVMVISQAEELAKLADSIAARADEMADRVRDPDAVNHYVRQAGHAEGVRDVLRWLTGQPPSAMLCDALDLQPEE